MKFSIKQLKNIIREAWWEEQYNKRMIDDEKYKEESALVPDEIKQKINKWFVNMKLQ